MRAAVLNESRRFEVREVPDPEPAAGALVVRVAGCGICGSDLHMVSEGITPPGIVLGHEASGVIEDVGRDVLGFVTGDPVAIHPLEPCGECPSCRSGSTGRCHTGLATTIGLGLRPGAFAERLEVTPGMLCRLPSDVPVELGALAEPLAVALHGFRRSRFSEGMTVGVIGCGPIGLCAVLVAKALGAGRIWATDPNPFRASLAGTLGADETGGSPKEADIVVECAGASGTLDLAVGSTRDEGQVILLAVNVSGDTVYPFSWVTKEVDVVGALAYARDEYDEAADMIATGRVDVAPMVTSRVSLDETDKAFFALLDGAPEGKVLVTP